MMGSKAFESPLISHARMRAMYRALVETRALSERAGRGPAGKLARGLEACWAGTAIDLKSGDLTNQNAGSALIEHVLRVGRRSGANAATAADVKKTMRAIAEERTSVAGTVTEPERLLCAVGQSMALQASGAKNVVVAYVEKGALKPADWKRIFAVAKPDLPLIVVCLPQGQRSAVDLDKAAKTAAANKNSVPVIPVDAGDVVALYRVTQESIGRARAEGGVALIECVAMGVDPVELMGTQLVKKRICTEAGLAGVASSFRRLLAAQT